jgi:Tic22-like family
MNIFQSWFLRVSLFGSTILGGALAIGLPAQAIPEAQVIAKLQNIPVYVITDDKGTIIHATNNGVKGQKPLTSTGVFFSREDAQGFIDRSIKAQQPEVGKLVKVTPVSLGEIYRRQQANRNKPEELAYIYVPTAKQASAALEILKQSGQKLDRVNELPVFIATTTSKAGKEEYLTFERNSQEIVPLFFSKETLQSTIKKVYPNLINKSKIQVIELNYLLGYMTKTSDRVVEFFEFNPNTEAK